MNWIERSEKQPQKATSVLVYNGSIYMADITFEGEAVTKSDRTPIDNYNRWTHWMPLPKPPIKQTTRSW